MAAETAAITLDSINTPITLAAQTIAAGAPGTNYATVGTITIAPNPGSYLSIDGKIDRLPPRLQGCLMISGTVTGSNVGNISLTRAPVIGGTHTEIIAGTGWDQTSNKACANLVETYPNTGLATLANGNFQFILNHLVGGEYILRVKNDGSNSAAMTIGPINVVFAPANAVIGAGASASAAATATA